MPSPLSTTTSLSVFSPNSPPCVLVVNIWSKLLARPLTQQLQPTKDTAHNNATNQNPPAFLAFSEKDRGD